ncbi:MAG TPA: hypothetical protein VNW95_00720 [Mucilaginibacter sp.]|jgi:hypothetical protein|nr:hypothetical protein [Mucilaginibacter sp.]
MKKIISYITIVFAASVVLGGCLPEKDSTRLAYKGPTLVEFKNFTAGQITTLKRSDGSGLESNASLTGRGISTSAADAQTDSTHAIHIGAPSPTGFIRATDSVLVQLVGPQRSTPTVVNYTVRSTSTAVEGTHYNFVPTGARTVTIPANSSSAYILINTIPNSVAAAPASATLILDLTGASGIPPSFNFKSFYIKFEK